MSAFVSVDIRGDDCFVIGYARSSAGPFRETGIFVRLTASADDASLGSAVIDVLASETPPPDDPDNRSVAQRELKIRSFGAYLVGVVAVYVEPTPEGLLRVTPTQNKGAGGGIVEMREGHIEVRAGDAAILGRAIRTGLQAST